MVIYMFKNRRFGIILLRWDNLAEREKKEKSTRSLSWFVHFWKIKWLHLQKDKWT